MLEIKRTVVAAQQALVGAGIKADGNVLRNLQRIAEAYDKASQKEAQQNREVLKTLQQNVYTTIPQKINSFENKKVELKLLQQGVEKRLNGVYDHRNQLTQSKTQEEQLSQKHNRLGGRQ